MKPNYRHERAQRTRSKAEKKQEKLRRQQEAVDLRKARDVPDDDPGPEAPASGGGAGETP